jgi:hypothetical protein
VLNIQVSGAKFSRPVQLSERVSGSFGMKTFLIVLAVFLAAVVLVEFWPLIIAPLAVIAAAGLLLGCLLAGGATLLLGLVAVVVLAVLGALVGLLTAAAPVWVPIVLIVGIVMLIKRSSRPSAVKV